MNRKRENGRRGFELTVNLGQVLTVCSIIFGAGGAYYGAITEIRYLDRQIVAVDKAINRRITNIETAIEKLTAITVATAELKSQLTAIERRMDRLERVPPPP
jgi:hypothetical protein